MKFCANCGTRLVLTRAKHDALKYRCPQCTYTEGNVSSPYEPMDVISRHPRTEVLSIKGLKKTNNEQPLFPYEPYLQQLEFMRDVHDVVGQGGVLVAEACNGFGKTVCALASIIPLGHRIVYATRTHEQVRQVLLEVERINRRSRKSFSAVNLASRQHLCLHDKCRTLTSLEAMEVCRLLKEGGECPYRTETQLPSALPLVLSIEALQRFGKSRKICPYFLARQVSETCTVIVAPYQYVFNTHIRSLVKLELTNKILVFDEAHNADQIGQEALSDTLSERTLNATRRELESINVVTAFVDDLMAHLARKVTEKPITEAGSTLREDLKKVLGVDKLSSFAEGYANIADEIRSHKEERGDAPVCFLNGILNFLRHVASTPAESYVAVYRKSRPGFNLVEYRCLDSSLAIRPIVKEAYGALIMSGTLSPLELFTEILGLEEAVTRTYSAIANPEYIRTVIDAQVTTRFTERGEGMTRRYGERISRLVAKVPNGVLIFFPQRRLMLDALSTWRGMGLMEEGRNHPLLGGKPVYVEGAWATENRRVVEAYKSAARTGRGAVLCGVFRGRNAEGSNFPYEEARAVILVGVPYADYSDPVVKAQIGYYNRKRRSLGERWYIMDAFRAANQAMGRGIRHRDDWCNFVLMDHRYQTHKHLISRWAMANGAQEIP